MIRIVINPFGILLNARVLTIITVLLGGIHFFVVIYLIDEPPGRLPWVVQVIVYLGLGYLIFHVIEHGETRIQRLLGYIGNYFMILIFLGTTLCYFFDLKSYVFMSCR